MAEKKTTSKKAAPKENVVIEENAGTPEVSSEEILAEEKPEVVQAEDRKEPAEDVLEEVEQAVEKFDEVTKNLEEKVAEIGNLEPQKVESAAKETLNEIREMEEELRKEIEAEEEALTPNQRKGMRRWLGDFWNGVSSGWDN